MPHTRLGARNSQLRALRRRRTRWLIRLSVVLPTLGLLGLVFAWQWHQVSTAASAQTALVMSRADRVFSEVEQQLNRYVATHGYRCTSDSIRGLRQIGFTQSAIREAAVINAGLLRCSSWGTANPPVAIDPAHAPTTGTQRHLTTYRGSGLEIDASVPSVILSVAVRGDNSVNALVDPDAILPLDLRDIRLPGGHYRLEFTNGALLHYAGGSTAAVVQLAGQDETFNAPASPTPWLQRALTADDFRVVASFDRSSLSRAVLTTELLLALGALGLAGLLLRARMKHLDARNSPEASMQLGIRLGEFRFDYQPAMNLETGRCVGAEALLRWQHADRGTLPPPLFLPFALASGLLPDMMSAATRQMAAELKPLFDAHPRFRVSINVDAQELALHGFLDELRANLDAAGMAYKNLVLEVTEVSNAQEAEAMRDTLTEARTLGFGTAIDDFGTGYSGLDYLRRFPFDYLKIDRSFVAGGKPGDLGERLLQTIVQLGQELDLLLVGEGVESEAQRAKLLSLGVTIGQGFLYAPALATAEFIAFVERHRTAGQPGVPGAVADSPEANMPDRPPI